eukprot:g7542.t1
MDYIHLGYPGTTVFKLLNIGYAALEEYNNKPRSRKRSYKEVYNENLADNSKKAARTVALRISEHVEKDKERRAAEAAAKKVGKQKVKKHLGDLSKCKDKLQTKMEKMLRKAEMEMSKTKMEVVEQMENKLARLQKRAELTIRRVQDEVKSKSKKIKDEVFRKLERIQNEYEQKIAINSEKIEAKVSSLELDVNVMTVQQSSASEVSPNYLIQGVDITKSILIGIVKECLRDSLKKINALGHRSGEAFGFRTNERNATFFKMNELVYQLWIKYLPPRDLYTLDEISMILEHDVIPESFFYFDGLLINTITPKKTIRKLLKKYGGGDDGDATVQNLVKFSRQKKLGIFVSIDDRRNVSIAYKRGHKNVTVIVKCFRRVEYGVGNKYLEFGSNEKDVEKHKEMKKELKIEL